MRVSSLSHLVRVRALESAFLRVQILELQKAELTKGLHRVVGSLRRDDKLHHLHLLRSVEDAERKEMRSERKRCTLDQRWKPCKEGTLERNPSRFALKGAAKKAKSSDASDGSFKVES